MKSFYFVSVLNEASIFWRQTVACAKASAVSLDRLCKLRKAWPTAVSIIIISNGTFKDLKSFAISILSSRNGSLGALCNLQWIFYIKTKIIT